jgi:hypothetical protein
LLGVRRLGCRWMSEQRGPEHQCYGCEKLSHLFPPRMAWHRPTPQSSNSIN